MDNAVLGEFLSALASLPDASIEESFSALELEHRIRSSAPSHARKADIVVNYLKSNGIEICFPSVHHGRLCGAVLLGAKDRGVFWPEERATLAVMASHMATAVRKSELLAINRELRGLDELKSDLISNITHEFKTPLNIVESAIDALFDDVNRGRLNPEKTADYLEMIRTNTETLGEFIVNLLEIGRIESAKVRLQRRPVDVSSVAAAAVARVRPLAERKGITITADESAPITAVLDAGKISSVIGNLLSNAVKFTDAGGVRVQIAHANGTVSLKVSDSGRGIPKECLPLLFEKFYQVPSSNAPEGTGLGLAIAKGWVEAHGGRIWAESAGPGLGSTFLVELPTSEPVEAATEIGKAV